MSRSSSTETSRSSGPPEPGAPNGRRGPDGANGAGAPLPLPVPKTAFADALHNLKWLRPGMRVKRWLLVALMGIALLVMGIDLMMLKQLADLGDRLNTWMFQHFGVSVVDFSPFRQITYQLLIGAPTAVLGLLV